LVLPDFIANAGGVICAAIEYRGGTAATALALIAEKIRTNTEAVLDEVRRTGGLPRTAAVSLATERGAGRCERGDGMQRRDELRQINVPPMLVTRIDAFPFH
jgi:glutamate dehydrogenase/leucine dehydrogenase